MSPTSYQTAPPRVFILTVGILSVKHAALIVRVVVCLLLSLSFPTLVKAQSSTSPLERMEAAFADLNDANSVIATIDSGLFQSYGGKDRAAWEQMYHVKRKDVVSEMAKIDSQKLNAEDRRAFALMKDALESMPEAVSTPMVAKAQCDDAIRKDIDEAALKGALYGCFTSLGGNLEFECKRYDRLGAMSALAVIPEVERRKKLFLAFRPLWQAINGSDDKTSPYRRLIAMAAKEDAKHGSNLHASARTVGATPKQVEHWLEQILDEWRKATAGESIEPWDYYYSGAEADRALAKFIPRSAMLPITERYYADLGADLKQLGVLYDLDPRPGKGPLAYTDYVVRGRYVDDRWQPTVVRVSANYSSGGLGQLNEFVHENGHAVHMMALRTRPAFMDLGDSVFYEAFADVPSWSTYEPTWQQRYLGHPVQTAVALKGLFSGVMLDVAWSLFEIRMLRDPQQDPNAVWTEITHKYLHVVPHPELSWWALRVQLVHEPGYMLNYGLGAVITADLRERIAESLAPMEAGDPRWYAWISQRLLASGEEHPTSELLRGFLGRPVSPQALMSQIRRLGQKN